MKSKSVLEERPVFNAVTLYRERGNYLQRKDQFEKAIQAYNDALKWNNDDIHSLLGRSLARAKATYYDGALADAVRAAELEPQNLTALQIRAQTQYEKCAFERALVLSHRGRHLRKTPDDFAECARHAEETVRECAGKNAGKVLYGAVPLLRDMEMKKSMVDDDQSVPLRKTRIVEQKTHQVEELSRVEKQKSDQMSRLLASKYLERMAHDKYFLIALCKDPRLESANKADSQILKDLANHALADVEKRQAVLRERRPLYAARAAEAAARARLSRARKEKIKHAQKQHIRDARRLVNITEAVYKERDTTKCLEQAEFALERISKKPANLLPGKEKFLQDIYGIVANAFLDQKRVGDKMSEQDRDMRAFVLLGMSVSREPSRDSVLRSRPPAPLDASTRLRDLERSLILSTRAPERCYILHELARLNIVIKQSQKARFYASKCQTEARAADQRVWFLNAIFLHARCHLLQNNRPEARAMLIEGATYARNYGLNEVSSFFDTCVNVSLEGEVIASEAALDAREKAMVSLMQDDDMKKKAEHLFRRMSVLPAARRFSVMPGTRLSDTPAAEGKMRRASINPYAQQGTRITTKRHHPLGFQDFDF